MKRLILDIETSPNLAYVWDLWAKEGITPDKLTEATEVLCLAYKWVGERGVGFASVWTHGKDEMVKLVWDLLDQADVVIHYNGKHFDIPHLNREMILAGLTPPSPYEQVDLFLAAKSKFKFPSNKLAYITKALGLRVKSDPGGFETWKRVLAGEAKAQATMERYNKRDVVVTEGLYHRLLPWIDGHPSAVLSGVTACPKCEGAIEWRGEYRSKTRRYKRYVCKDCGSWGRTIKSTGGAVLTGVAA